MRKYDSIGSAPVESKNCRSVASKKGWGITPSNSLSWGLIWVLFKAIQRADVSYHPMCYAGW